jgi:hypothetical protein
MIRENMLPQSSGSRWRQHATHINNHVPHFHTADCVWNVMAHAQKQHFIFRRNGRVHLNWRGRQFSRLLAVEMCASAVVMLDTPCFEVVWRVLATHSIHQFPLHFPSRGSPCAITFQLDSTTYSLYPSRNQVKVHRILFPTAAVILRGLFRG